MTGMSGFRKFFMVHLLFKVPARERLQKAHLEKVKKESLLSTSLGLSFSLSSL